ncbi:hypothetical protein [Thermostichus vulcanus]|uniref:Uncharacterized protein n=1 Tax=Thermostichus vulcanus str. 'Rupite' TaxID=2813851 RepID=A0ABT0C7B4_THEVL|nr:hypothetical protein [Thermostichus vulcanus]MCJ2541683.1 hypothetical protein [Thermostichus vulcanus str. 'Rupite']
MSIHEIIQEVFQSSILTLQQESAINQILLERTYNPSDLDALDELIEAIVRKEIQTSSDHYGTHVAA